VAVRLVSTILLSALAFAPAGNAFAGPVDFSFDFSTSKPRAATDADLHILYKDPDDPDGKPPALTQVTIVAPRGTVFDGSAVPACEASNGTLMLLGQAACPPESNVGGGFGSILLDPGPSEPITAEVTLFNYGDGIAELLEFGGGAVRVIDRAEFQGRNRMVLHPAVVPAVTEREFSFTYRGKPVAGGKPFITTPRACPRRGRWVSRLSYRVTTGARYRARSKTPCDFRPEGGSAGSQ
jgi:hypothetical protein